MGGCWAEGAWARAELGGTCPSFPFLVGGGGQEAKEVGPLGLGLAGELTARTAAHRNTHARVQGYSAANTH